MPASDQPVEADRTLRRCPLSMRCRVSTAGSTKLSGQAPPLPATSSRTEPSTKVSPRISQPKSGVLFTAHYLVIGARLPTTVKARASLQTSSCGQQSRRQRHVPGVPRHVPAIGETQLLATNPVGVERDGLVRDEGPGQLGMGRHLAGGVHQERGWGWTAEIAIPFSTLRFHPESGEGWGLNFGRVVARTGGAHLLVAGQARLGFQRAVPHVVIRRTVRHLRTAPASRLSLKPYVLTGAERDIEDNPTGTDFAHQGRPRRQSGVDAHHRRPNDGQHRLRPGGIRPRSK